MAQGSSKPTVEIGGQPVEVETVDEKDLLAEILQTLQELLRFVRESQ